MKIDYNKLPPLVREILQGFFHPLKMDIDDLSLINAINVKLSQFLSNKRITFQGNHGTRLINYYSINICPSGGGKDQSLNLLDKLIFKDFKEFFYKNRETYLEQQEYDLRNEACSRYKKNEAKINSYIEEKLGAIRTLHYEENPKTPEGFYESCIGFLNYDKGSVFIRNSEFASTMKTVKPEKLATYDAIMEASEGSLLVATTKGEKKSRPIENIPINVIFVTDGTILVEDKKAKDLFYSILRKGFARRSNISYQKHPDIKFHKDFQSAKALRQQAFKNARIIAERLSIIDNKIQDKAYIKMSEKAEESLYYYEEQCKREAEEFKGQEHEIILINVRQRFWKAYKLAALIACLINPEELIINAEAVEMAIYQVELFHESLKEYIGSTPKSDHEKVFRFLCKNLDTWVSKTKLREQDFAPSANGFKRWWEEIYEHVESFADSKGYSLEDRQGKGRAVDYRLVKNNIGTELSPHVTSPENVMEMM